MPSTQRQNLKRLLLRTRREKVAAIGRDTAELDAIDADIVLLTTDKDSVKDWSAEFEAVQYIYALRDDARGRFVKGEVIDLSRIVPLELGSGGTLEKNSGNWSEVQEDEADAGIIAAWEARELVHDFRTGKLAIERGGSGG